MQSKPNFQKSQMNVNLYNRRAYENIANWTLGQNKPNSNPIQTQSKPISSKAKMNVNSFIKKDYRKTMISQSEKTNPIQTQNKANFKPPGNEPKKLKRKIGYQELFYVSGLPERLTF